MLPTVDEGLLAVVLGRLDETAPDPAVEAAVLAALDSDNALDEALASPARPATRADRNPADTGDAAVDGPGAYLRRLTVTGFRGIGPAASLEIDPGPGLTVVAGRNGSGKSSFAEAFEVLMTGTLKRWESRSADWKETWRCLHSPVTEVTAEVAVEGVNGPTVLTRRWEPEVAKLDGAVTSVQPYGQAKIGLDGWGWDRAVSEQRPFLSHAELEALLAQPKALHDQLNDLLGLEDLESATGRLTTRRLALDKQIKQPRQHLADLKAALQASSDARAANAGTLLAAKHPALDALEALATGTARTDEGPVAALIELAAVVVPDVEEVGKVAAAVRADAARLDTVEAGLAAEALTAITLLHAALEHVERHPTADCPVCGTPGAIDDPWRARTVGRLQRIEEDTAALTASRQQLADTVRRARQLITSPPAVLARADTGVNTTAAAAAWANWAAPPAGEGTVAAIALADHLANLGPSLASEVEDLRRRAAAELQDHQDQWAPVATALAEWCSLERASRRAKPSLEVVKAAEAWLKAANETLRNDRLRPLADQTVEFWNELRQGSNVDLRELRLVGSGNKARVDFRVTVDGADATGLGVMSQGEANALALSVFLPRAMLPGSPFRFLVIDDPIQAMDPNKVDGLARLLVRVAEHHQVVVFTHDNRLPESLRRLALPGKILAVSRRDRSQVQVDIDSDPVTRLLHDARQVIGNDKIRHRVPAPVAARVVPGICRTALETVLNEIVRRRLLNKGAAHQHVEAAISDAHRLRERAALAVWGDAEQHDKVDSWIEDRIGPWAKHTFRALNAGSHGEDIGVLDTLVTDTRRLADQLRQRLT